MIQEPSGYEDFKSILLSESKIELTKTQSDILFLVMLDPKKIFNEFLIFTINKALTYQTVKLDELYHLLDKFSKFSKNKLYTELNFKNYEEWKTAINKQRKLEHIA